jgi:hypothetical protein
MQLQVQDIIKDAMALIGATEMDETPSASELFAAMRIANIMLGRWGTQEYTVRASSTLTIPISSGKCSYTIALNDADIIAPKPIAVQSGFLRSVNNIDTPLEVVPITIYNSFPSKLALGFPHYISYDPGESQQANQTGTLFVYPASTNGTIILKTTTSLLEFTSLTDIVTLESVYYEALLYNLAVRLFRRYHVTGEIPQDIVAIATSSIRNLSTLNSSRILAHSDFGNISAYNVYTG